MSIKRFKKTANSGGISKMYVHKRCVPEGAEQDLEKVAHGYCGVCGKRGTIWLVKGTEDSYKTKKQGVTYTIIEGVEQGVNVTVPLVLDEIAPVETPLEAELAEETEAIAEAPTEAVEAVEEASIPEEKEPEETVVEAEPDATETLDEDFDIAEKLEIETPPEAKSEPSVEAVAETLDILADDTYADLLPPETDKKAEIARLEAELEALRK